MENLPEHEFYKNSIEMYSHWPFSGFRPHSHCKISTQCRKFVEHNRFQCMMMFNVRIRFHDSNGGKPSSGYGGKGNFLNHVERRFLFGKHTNDFMMIICDRSLNDSNQIDVFTFKTHGAATCRRWRSRNESIIMVLHPSPFCSLFFLRTRKSLRRRTRNEVFSLREDR